jgi:hypothetical protein
MIILAVYGKFPDSLLVRKYHQQINDELLRCRRSPGFTQTGGADINYLDEDGFKCIIYCFKSGAEIDLAYFRSRLEQTSRSIKMTSLVVSAIYYDSDINVIKSMLEKSVSMEFEIEALVTSGIFKQSENMVLLTLLKPMRHQVLFISLYIFAA